MNMLLTHHLISHIVTCMTSMKPADIKKLCEDSLGMTQADLAKALAIPAVTWYRHMKEEDGSRIPEDIQRLLLCFQEVVRNHKATHLSHQEIREAAMSTGVAGVVARAAMAGVIPRPLVSLLAASAPYSWIGALGGAVAGIGVAAALSFFQKLKAKPETNQKEQ